VSAGAITSILAWEAFDSRGTPTVACAVETADGAEGHVVVPSGASTGSHEAHELRDGGARYGGRGVRRAVAAVRDELAPALIGADARDQAALDARLRDLDGTPDLGRLGANAVLAVSLAAAIAGARSDRRPLFRHLAREREPVLPLPMVNVVSGGAHAARAIDVQDVLVVPVGATSFAQAIEWAWRVRTAAAELAGGSLVADEGGIAATFARNADALVLVAQAIERAGLEPGTDAAIAVDIAATQLVGDEGYVLACEGRSLDAQGLVAEIAGWCERHPVVSVEDPLAEDDWPGWVAAAGRLGDRVQLLGDDLLVTDGARIRRAAELHAANAVLVKPNQVGTLSDALAAVATAQELGMAAVVSARSGDSEDDWLADLATGSAAGQIKVGSTQRSERTAKWNRLLRIEAQYGLPFAGRAALAPLGRRWGARARRRR
jgi:enolase